MGGNDLLMNAMYSDFENNQDTFSDLNLRILIDFLILNGMTSFKDLRASKMHSSFP